MSSSGKSKSRALSRFKNRADFVTSLLKTPPLEKPRKRRDGTPEKSAISNVSQEAIRDEMATRANVIWNEEIEALVIKDEELQKLHGKRSVAEGTTTPPPIKFIVRKSISPQKTAPAKKTLIVAKPAPTDSPLKPVDHIGQAGVRYDINGDVVPHSILGDYDDFYNEAIRRGDLLDLPAPKLKPPATPISNGVKKSPLVTTSKRMNESNALRHWDDTMVKRQQMINHVANKTMKEPQSLVMTVTDQYRDKQELRHLIDRTIPLVDYGKGYRVYSEFWNQPERLADEELGIHMTLTQTEQGFAPPIEQLGSSDMAKLERGVETSDKQDMWGSNDYLHERTSQLCQFIHELRPHKPEFSALEVIGTSNPDVNVLINPNIRQSTASEKENKSPRATENDPLSQYPDVRAEMIFGPSISFAGQPARWTGDSHQFRGETAIEARVSFEVLAGSRVVSKLQIVNDGTTSIHYSWEKVAKDNPFSVFHEQVQRFYFNTSNGVILPGDSIKFPFVFKSSTGGVFMEQWRFITAPVVCGGADLLVTLRGVAVQEDVHCQTRVEIEEMLHARQTQRIVGDILDDLVSGVRTPPRSRSPIDAHITPEEVFTRNNPGLQYRDTQINELREVYAELCPDTEWDLSIDRIKQACMDLGEDEEEKREEVLHKLNEIVVKLSFPKFTPIQENMHRVGCQVLREAIDAIVGQSMLIRHLLRLPSRDLDEMPEEDRRKGDRRDTIKKSASKDPAKVKSVNKFDTRSSKPNSKTPSKVQSRILAGQGENTRSLSPPEQPSSPLDKLEMSDPNLMRKYTEKLNSQAYLIMRDCVNKMADAFEEIQKIEGEAYAFDLIKSTA